MAKKTDAIELLKQDHREIEDLFEQYDDATDAEEKQDLALEIVEAIRLDMLVKAETFYPAVRGAIKKTELIDDALVELDAADYVATLLEEEADDALFDARVRVLRRLFAAHAERQEDELFKKVKNSDLDLSVLGEQVAERKAELMAEEEDDEEDEAEELDGELPLDAEDEDDDDDRRD